MACLLGGATSSPLAAQSGVDVEPVMAAFVHRFTQFVEWPDGALQGRDEFGICVAAPESMVQAVRSLVDDAEFRGRPFDARIVEPSELEGCQVLFVSGDEAPVAELLAAAAGRPILTVSDAPGFLDRGGMIELRVLDRRVRFGVNVLSTAGAGLRLSSQLLDLAIEVRGGEQT